MRKFQLELHPEKTRLIEFGRHAAKNRKRAGLGKPETFSFLGFTRSLGQNPSPPSSHLGNDARRTRYGVFCVRLTSL
jgi:hypothetical protein